MLFSGCLYWVIELRSSECDSILFALCNAERCLEPYSLIHFISQVEEEKDVIPPIPDPLGISSVDLRSIQAFYAQGEFACV